MLEGNKQNRHDMIVEIVSNMITDIEQLVVKGDREELEAWLAPLLHASVADEYKNEDDSALADLYERQLGVHPAGWRED